MEKAEPDVLWTVDEAAAFLKMAKGSVYHLSSEKRIPTIHLSARAIRFSKRQLEAWVASKSEGGS